MQILKMPNLIRIFLILVAVHSIVVGVNLISFPTDWMQKFGFHPITENFFKIQGGVFHLVMAVAYLIPVWKPLEYRIMIVFSITAKFIAVLFLMLYFILIENNITILLSAIGDFLMGIILLFLLMQLEQ